MNPTTVKSRLGDMKTIAQQLNVTDFPFEIKNNNGNIIYYENSNEFWVKWEFDSNGNPTSYENSDGWWYKCEYDSNEKTIYYEDSSELWIKREYDSLGRVIYYEDSYGHIEDNRPKPCVDKVVEIDGIKYKLTAV
jgi:YD repeat-containing protein